MERYGEYYRIARLIAASLTGEISPKEKEYLSKWLEESDDNKKIYESIATRLKKGETIKSYRNRSVIEADWKTVQSKLGHKKVHSLSFHPRMQYVAVIALVFCVGIAAFYIQDHKRKGTVPLAVQQNFIKAGNLKAVLTLADGQQVVLEQCTEGNIQAGNLLIEQKQGELDYQKINRTEDSCEIFNTINTPKGGEYKLILADGTRVWVNSESELKYPVKFTEKTRMVYIKGEAYFEVTPDAEKPFVVQTPDSMLVKVLGTHFNISAYEEDETIATTLAEGKVEVSDGKQTMILEPNQQSIFDKKEKHFTCHTVDPYQYLSWKDGKFIFEKETLENIMERLERWYNIQVFFKSEKVKKLRFSGDLEKYDNFSTAVRMLEKVSCIKVEIDKTAIYIGEK